MLLEKFTITPTIDTAAYAQHDVVGGLLDIEHFFGESSVQAILESIVILDRHKQAKDLDLLFFAKNPSASTITDNAALSLHDDDASKFLGYLSFGVTGADYVDFGGFSMAQMKDINMALKGEPGNSTLYMAVVCRDATGADYNAATDLSIILTVRRN